jgi:hypothetical protein
LEKIIDEDFSKLSKEEYLDNNTRIFTVQKAAMKTLKVSSVEEVIKLLVLR